MRNSKVYEITVISTFTALIIVMALVPMLGFIQIGAVAVTIIHIPVLIGGIFGGRKVSVSLGLAFGLLSLIVALTRPSGPIDLLFQNPMISVLPRVLFGLGMYELYRLFTKLFKNNEYISIPVAMILGTLLHSVLVLTALFVFGRATLADLGITELFPFIWAVMLTNGFIEAALAGLIGGPIAKALLSAKVRDLV
jgi:uncharacterized membrane protein